MSLTVTPRMTSAVLVATVVGVGAFAFLRPSVMSTASTRATEPAAAGGPSMPALPNPSDRSDPSDPSDPNDRSGAGAMAKLGPVNESQPLPPGHPDISHAGGGAMQAGMAPPPNDDPASITWKAPAGWTTIPNPSTMRLATYRVPRAPSVTDDADVAVTRAGGSVDANIERWVGQFETHGKETRAEKTVRGIKVTLVDVSGTFVTGGGPMMQGAATSKPGWSLLAAIVESPGAPYFFKLTGPSSSVAAARASFVALVDSVTPS